MKELQNAMDNISQLGDFVFTVASPLIVELYRVMFWSASDILYNVDQICCEAESYRARALERQIPREDFDLLGSALTHA